MRRILYTLTAIVLFFIPLFSPAPAAASVCFIPNGCTGTSTAPGYGKVLIGGKNGEYEFVATSTFGGGGGGTFTSIGPAGQLQTGPSVTIASSSDTNLGLTVTGSGNILTFILNWLGILTAGRGGTGISNPSAAGVLLGSYGGGSWQQLATSSLGLLTTNVAEGTSLYFTNGRAVSALTGQNISIFNNNSNYITASGAPVQSVFGRTGAVTAQTGDYTTSQVSEGTNLYFTNARADARFVAGLAATTSVKSITTLPSLSLPYSQLTGTPTIPSKTSDLTNDSGFVTSSFSTTSANYWGGTKGYSTFAYPFPSNATTTNITFSNGLTGTLTGNADTATKLATARNINGVSFDGTGNISITAASSTLLGDNNTLSGADSFTNASSNFGGTWQTYSPSHFQSALTLTTTGTSGAATLSGGTLNIPQYPGGGGSSASSTLLSDNNTFSGLNSFGSLNASGKIGIGTTSPKEMLNLSQSTGYTTARLDSGTHSGYISVNDTYPALNLFSVSNDPVQFGVHGVPVGQWDTSGNFDIGATANTQVQLSSIPTYGYLNIQGAGSGDNGEDTIVQIKAPAVNPQEATLTLVRDAGSGNREFTDITDENYNTAAGTTLGGGIDHLMSINISKQGTGTLRPFGIRFWNQDLGNIAANGLWNLISDPNGSTAFGRYSTTTAATANSQSSMSILANTGLSNAFQIDNPAGTHVATINPLGGMTLNNPLNVYVNGAGNQYFFTQGDGAGGINFGAYNSSFVPLKIDAWPLALNSRASGQPVAIGTTTGTASLNIALNGNSNLLDLLNSSNTPVVRVTGAGNVGIGTTTPGTLLSLGGTGGSNFSVTSTSTLATGVNLVSGCFAVNGTCISGGGGSSASSTLLSDNNTFSGATTTFSGVLALGASYISRFSNIFTHRSVEVCASTVKITAGCDYVADGTDDQVQIQAAYEAAASLSGNNGGIVTLSPGTFWVSATTTLDKPDVTVQGSGLDATIIKVANSANTSVFAYTGSSNIIFDSLRDFTIDGNRSNNTYGYGIYIQPSGTTTFWDFTVRDVWTKELSSDGLYMYDDHGLVLDHYLSEYNDGNGMTINGTGADSGRGTGGTFLFNGGNGVVIGADGFTFGSNVVGNSTGNGIVVTGDNAVIQNNYLASDGDSTHDEIVASSTGAQISGNSIKSTSARYGVTVSSGSTNVIITNNSLKGTGGLINDNGTGTQRMNNGDGIITFFGPPGAGAKMTLYNGSGNPAMQLFGNTISNLNGNLYLNYFGIAPTEIGTADAPVYASTNNDLYVSNILEVAGKAYFPFASSTSITASNFNSSATTTLQGNNGVNIGNGSHGIHVIAGSSTTTISFY